MLYGKLIKLTVKCLTTCCSFYIDCIQRKYREKLVILKPSRVLRLKQSTFEYGHNKNKVITYLNNTLAEKSNE